MCGKGLVNTREVSVYLRLHKAEELALKRLCGAPTMTSATQGQSLLNEE